MKGLALDVRPEVAEAVASGGAVVALESTLIALGLPWPLNLETAQAAEQAVRENHRLRLGRDLEIDVSTSQSRSVLGDITHIAARQLIGPKTAHEGERRSRGMRRRRKCPQSLGGGRIQLGQRASLEGAGQHVDADLE